MEPLCPRQQALGNRLTLFLERGVSPASCRHSNRSRVRAHALSTGCAKVRLLPFLVPLSEPSTLVIALSSVLGDRLWPPSGSHTVGSQGHPQESEQVLVSG